ncbi:MBOAT family O-acyltransferase [Crocosphaera sp.]|uniref:MBOAT family O-acyltransferase n=1 Tax=Crocosphaera sp. TaxID=2729996 RepID=UPI003F24BF23
MLFNSIDFAIFLPIVFILYWLLQRRSLRLQNLLIVGASYFFYGQWDYRFLGLIIFSTLTDYLIGLRLGKPHVKPTVRKVLLFTSIGVNLGILGLFKYYNFFLENITTVFSFFGQDIPISSLNIILPVGISFYTFQTLSYSIDVYQRKIKATQDLIAFSAFVSFFPQLVAGPIERAAHLLPQFHRQRKFNYYEAVDGLRQILWGLFKKMVIADNCATYANEIFNNSSNYSGSTLLLGAFFFTFQIYGDFSGYSDIAIGVAKLFGFDLMQNFAFPYFSRDVAEFWRRWHISLSTWFRDYLYIPLGGSRGGTGMKVRNTFLIFLVSGFWHGANWTFIVWGAINAIYFLPLLLLRKNRQNMDIAGQGKYLPSAKEVLSIAVTFGLTMLAWIFFRAENLNHALSYIQGIFNSSLLSIPDFPNRKDAVFFLILIVYFVLIEWLGRENQYAIEKLFLKQNRILRWIYYYSLIYMIIFFAGQEQDFIYFQF